MKSFILVDMFSSQENVSDVKFSQFLFSIDNIHENSHKILNLFKMFNQL